MLLNAVRLIAVFGNFDGSDMRNKNPKLYRLEDHLCRHCGGRVLRCVSGSGVTPGGNPVFMCADCGKSSCGLGPGGLCWCGFTHRHNHETPYMCLPFEGNEKYRRQFQDCGCDPDNGKAQIGIVLIESLRETVAE